MIILDLMQRGSGIVKECAFFMYDERLWDCEGVIPLYVMQSGSETVKE